MKRYFIKVLTNEGVVDWNNKIRYSTIYNKDFNTIEEINNFIDSFKSFPRFDFIVYDNNKIILDTTSKEEITKQVHNFNDTWEYREDIKARLLKLN